MKIKEIAFSCYSIKDVDKAKDFYGGVLGLVETMDHKIEGGRWIEYDIGNGTLALGKSEGMEPSKDGCSVVLEVENFDEALSKLKEKGVSFSFGPIETEVCHMAFVFDPDGNTVGIHKRKDD